MSHVIEDGPARPDNSAAAYAQKRASQADARARGVNVIDPQFTGYNPAERQSDVIATQNDARLRGVNVIDGGKRKHRKSKKYRIKTRSFYDKR